MNDRRLWLALSLAIVLFSAHALAQEAIPPAPEGTGDAPAPSPPASDYMTGLHYCEDDSDCGWDNPCTPSACVPPEMQQNDIACTETWPPRGTCSCVDNWCTMRPNEPSGRASEPGCTTDADCGIDLSTGACHLDSAIGRPPIEIEGPICSCVAETTRCTFEWIEPVPCESFRDCWYEREPRLHPVPAPTPREEPFEPCVDGEIDSVCIESPAGKFCRIVAWEC